MYTASYDYRYAASLSGKYYHGTSSKFDKFDLDHAGARDWGDFGVGVYLTPSGRLAAMYAYDSAKKTHGEPIILQCKVRARKTADLDDPEMQAQIANALDIPFPHKAIGSGMHQTRPKSEAEAITRYLRSLGYDSGLGRGGKELAVYETDAITIDRTIPAEDGAYLL